MKILTKVLAALLLPSVVSGCSTAIVMADTAASAVIYAGKTVISGIDGVTPDIVNKDQ